MIPKENMKSYVTISIFMFQGDDFDVNKSRKRRHVTDSNGNRILRVVKRDATEMAEVETTEKIIQVIITKIQLI